MNLLNYIKSLCTESKIFLSNIRDDIWTKLQVFLLKQINIKGAEKCIAQEIQ